MFGTFTTNTPRGYTASIKSEIKKKALRRLRIIHGQLKGLSQMIEDEKYCIDVITQVEAVRQALSGVKNIMLENHLSTHLAHQMRHGEQKKATDEILKVYRLGQD